MIQIRYYYRKQISLL